MATDYQRFRGRCKEMAEAAVAADPTLTLARAKPAVRRRTLDEIIDASIARRSRRKGAPESASEAAND